MRVRDIRFFGNGFLYRRGVFCRFTAQKALSGYPFFAFFLYSIHRTLLFFVYHTIKRTLCDYNKKCSFMFIKKFFLIFLSNCLLFLLYMLFSFGCFAWYYFIAWQFDIGAIYQEKRNDSKAVHGFVCVCDFGKLWL